MSNPVLDTGLGVLSFARNNTLGFVEGIPQDRLAHQPFSGANHVLWNLGHLAQTDDYFLSQFRKVQPQLPENWGTLFGMGSKPVPEASAYPPLEQLKEAMHSRREELLGWFKSMDAAHLATPLPKDWQPFAPDFGTLMASIAWHEGMHAGQIVAVRKSLGLTPRFG